jgi:hypothetical protein
MVLIKFLLNSACNSSSCSIVLVHAVRPTLFDLRYGRLVPRVSEPSSPTPVRIDKDIDQATGLSFFYHQGSSLVITFLFPCYCGEWGPLSDEIDAAQRAGVNVNVIHAIEGSSFTVRAT